MGPRAFTPGFSVTQPPYYALVAITLIALLVLLNVVGIRYSSKLNELIVAVDLVTVALFLTFGLPSIIASGALASWLRSLPSAFSTGAFGGPANYTTFVYALSPATAPYIGIESISKAAEETKRPGSVIPKATKAAIVAVITVAISLSLLSVTLSPFSDVANNSTSPAVTLAVRLPVIGAVFAVCVCTLASIETAGHQ